MKALFYHNQKLATTNSIQFNIYEGVEPKQVYKRLLRLYKNCPPSLATVCNWITGLKCSRTSLEGDPH